MLYNPGMWIGVVAVATVVGLIAPWLWLRRIAVVLVAGIALIAVDLLNADIRAHVSEARSLGRSRDFIDGMIARDQRLDPLRFVSFFCVVGLTSLAFTNPREKKAINAPLTPEEPPQQE